MIAQLNNDMDYDMQTEIRAQAIYNNQYNQPKIRNNDVKQIIKAIVDEDIGGSPVSVGDVLVTANLGGGHYTVNIFGDDYDFLIMNFKHYDHRLIHKLKNNIEECDPEMLYASIEEGETKFKLENELTYKKEALEVTYNTSECCVCLNCYDEDKEKIFIHCGHSFCNECHANICQDNRKCPYCRKDFEDAEGEGEPYTLNDIEELIEEDNTEKLLKIINIDDLAYCYIQEFGYSEAMGYDEHITDFNKIIIMWR